MNALDASPPALKMLAAATLPVAPSRMFTYPTRLAGAWQPGILDVRLPGYELSRPEIALAARRGSTQSLGIPHGRFPRRFYRKLAAPLVVEDGAVYDARYETDGNIAHILTVVAPPALAAREVFPRVTVVLRAKATPMARAAYQLLGLAVLCTDREVEGNLLVAPSGAEGAYEGHYRALFGGLPLDGHQAPTPQRVFLSRRGARCLLNEASVEAVLGKYGFQKVYFEDVPIPEQWSIARNAQVIVGLHGAALASLVFSRGGVKLVELFHPGYVVDMYRNLVNVVGGTWVGVTGQMPATLVRDLDEKGDPRSFAAASTRIDEGSLELALRHLGVGPE